MADIISMGPDGLNVPDEPIIPFIEGDGIGPDIWKASVRVFDAVGREGLRRRQAHRRGRRCSPGQKAFDETGDWLPDETIDIFQSHLIGIKGPLTTPVGEGFRSLNVALRQILDLYVCLRPVRWYQGVPSPGEAPREDRHGHLPREHRGRVLRQGAAGRLRGGQAGAGVLQRDLRLGHPRGLRHRHQARQRDRLQAPDPRGHRVRAGQQPALGDAGAQGQHHEVHRGRVPLLGLRAGRGRVQRRRRVAGRTPAASRATSCWSRTSSPTRCSSRS